MASIKRILRQTTNKLLSKLGAQRHSHQRIVLNHPNSPTSAKNLAQIKATCQQRSSKSYRRREKVSKKENFTPEAVLLAAKSNLPPVQFHHVHGPNALLSKNKYVARRSQSFCQALVFSNRVILPNERVYIKVLEIAKGWSGTIRFGFTSVDPATLRYQMPKHACPDMTSAGHTWARALADEVVRRNSVIHFSYNSNGYIHYGINNQDCGIFYANVNTSQHLWFIVDIYGLTAAVELIDPRIHNGSFSELDLSRLDEEPDSQGLDSSVRGTMYKSTSAMHQLCDSTTTRTKKKRSRKSAARQTALVYEQWHPEGLLMTSPLDARFNLQPLNNPNILPNLNSIFLPSAQQNIYSPMPMMNRGEANEYHQILQQTNNTAHQQQHQNESHSTTNNARIQRQPLANLSNQVSSSSSALNSLAVAAAGGSRADVREMSHQLDGMHVTSTSDKNKRQLSSLAGKSAKSTATINGNPAPVAAMRRRLQANSSLQTTPTTVSSKQKTSESGSQAKITHSGVVGHQNVFGTKVKNTNGSSPSSSSSSATNTANLKPKTRQSLKKAPLSSRDNNNASPTSKDCPICFERPINCVLYQCGHMCTCYECGVKQWRTQSRTCPICRTVIKDVIKTYMS